jgi:hypothetical protein
LALEARLGAALDQLLTAVRLPLRPPGASGSKMCMPAGLETPAGLEMPAERGAMVAGLQHKQHVNIANVVSCQGFGKRLLTTLELTNA